MMLEVKPFIAHPTKRLLTFSEGTTKIEIPFDSRMSWGQLLLVFTQVSAGLAQLVLKEKRIITPGDAPTGR